MTVEWSATTRVAIGHSLVGGASSLVSAADASAFVARLVERALAVAEHLTTGVHSSDVGFKIGMTTVGDAGERVDADDASTWPWPLVARRASAYDQRTTVVVALTCIVRVPSALAAFGINRRDWAACLERRVATDAERRARDERSYTLLSRDTAGGGRAASAHVDAPSIVYVAVAHPLAAMRRRLLGATTRVPRASRAVVQHVVAVVEEARSVLESCNRRAPTRQAQRYAAIERDSFVYMLIHATNVAHEWLRRHTTTRTHRASIERMLDACVALHALADEYASVAARLARLIAWMRRRCAARTLDERCALYATLADLYDE